MTLRDVTDALAQWKDGHGNPRRIVLHPDDEAEIIEELRPLFERAGEVMSSIPFKRIGKGTSDIAWSTSPDVPRGEVKFQ